MIVSLSEMRSSSLTLVPICLSNLEVFWKKSEDAWMKNWKKCVLTLMCLSQNILANMLCKRNEGEILKKHFHTLVSWHFQAPSFALSFWYSSTLVSKSLPSLSFQLSLKSNMIFTTRKIMSNGHNQLHKFYVYRFYVYRFYGLPPDLFQDNSEQ